MRETPLLWAAALHSEGLSAGKAQVHLTSVGFENSKKFLYVRIHVFECASSQVGYG